MCPEPKTELKWSQMSTGQKFKRVVKIAAAIFLCVIAVMLAGYFRYQRIPGLKRIDKLKVDKYEVFFSSYDGKDFTWIAQHAKDKKEAEKFIKEIHNFNYTRGIKVNDWTEDKITYQIYSLTIRQVNFKGPNEYGETVVWTNGYLITSTGDVYKCNPDFSFFAEADEDDFEMNTEDVEIAGLRWIRPLEYVYDKWNKDLIRPSGNLPEERAEGVEAEVTEVSELNGLPYVTISLKNTGITKWNYEDYSLFVYLEAEVDGEYYSIPHDPVIDDDIRTVPGYSKSIAPGEETEIRVSLAFFGKLPSGEYRIVICGKTGAEYNFASAEYHID